MQSIVVAGLVAGPSQAFTRWTDARRRWPGRAGGGHGRPGRAAAPTSGAGSGGDAEDRRAAACRRRGDGGRRVRPGARPARRRAHDRQPDPRAQGRGRRGPVDRGVVAVPRATQGRPAQDGRPGRPARPGAAQHPGAGAADRGRGLPPATGAGLLLAARARPRRRRRHRGRGARGRPDGGGGPHRAARRRRCQRPGRAHRRARRRGDPRPAAVRGRRPADGHRARPDGVHRRAAASTPR